MGNNKNQTQWKQAERWHEFGAAVVKITEVLTILSQTRISEAGLSNAVNRLLDRKARHVVIGKAR